MAMLVFQPSVDFLRPERSPCGFGSLSPVGQTRANKLGSRGDLHPAEGLLGLHLSLQIMKLRVRVYLSEVREQGSGGGQIHLVTSSPPGKSSNAAFLYFSEFLPVLKLSTWGR